MSSDRSNSRGIPLPLLTYWKPEAEGEWDLVQGLLAPLPDPLLRELLAHYYISAKTWPLVLLTGRPETDRGRLFYLLAQGIAGCADGQVLLLSAQSRWENNGGKESANCPGDPSRPLLGALQGRFNTWAFMDMLTDAALPGNEGLAYFLGLDQATPDELREYLDLYLVRHEEGPQPLPANVYLTAIVSVPGGAWCLPPFLLDRVGVVEVSVPWPAESPPSAPSCPPVGWQRAFLRSTLRDPERARRRLQTIGLLGEFQRLLEGLPAALRAAIDPQRREGLLLYAANSFTAEGHGLLDRVARANLRQALDLQLAQRLLPCIAPELPWSTEAQEEVLKRLGGSFPRTHARVRRLWLEQQAGEVSTEAAAPSSSPIERRRR